MTIAILARDLIIASRIADGAARIGSETLRVDEPAELPPPETVRLLLVDWGGREPGWADVLQAWLASAGSEERPRVVLFGPHTDLAAHRAARDAGLGPMLARSRLATALPELLRGGL